MRREIQEHFDEEEPQEEYFNVLHALFRSGLIERLQKKLKLFNIGFVKKKVKLYFKMSVI